MRTAWARKKINKQTNKQTRKAEKRNNNKKQKNKTKQTNQKKQIDISIFYTCKSASLSESCKI